MKILFDHQVFSLEVMGGMSKYYTQLMQGLIDEWHDVVVPVRRTHNYYLQSKAKYLGWRNYRTWLQRLSFKWRQNLVFWFNKILFLWKYKTLLQWVDLVHITLYDPYMIDILKDLNIPYIFNVYDLNHKTQAPSKRLFDLKMCDYSEHGITALGNQAKAIICISWQTKRDLLHYYPTIKESLIHIIYHGIDVDYYRLLLTQSPDQLLPTTPYILFIWKRKALYKNFERFIYAVAPLLSDTMNLVCLGHEWFSSYEYWLFASLWITHYVKQVTWDELYKAHLLNQCSCFVFPSLAEWFGIPIIEAWACGAPVVCSSILVFREIAQWAALYMDWSNGDNMCEIINAVIHNKTLQDNLTQQWYQRVQSFDKSVEITTTLLLYRHLTF